jgi:serine/threonine protein kinase
VGSTEIGTRQAKAPTLCDSGRELAEHRSPPAPPPPGRKPPPVPKGPIKAKRKIDEDAKTQVSKAVPQVAPRRIDDDQMTVRRAAPKPAPRREPIAGGPRYRTTGLRWAHPLGQVHNAVDTETSDRVMVTMLHPAAGLSDAHVDASRATANVIGGLGRPYLNRIVDVVRQSDNRLWIVTEYLNASVLSEQLGKKVLPVPRVIGILRQVCRALGDAHRAGVSHGALSVASVLLTGIHGRPDSVVVTDFGLQGVIDAELDIPSIGAALQPVTPERILGLPRSEKEDMYLVGCIAYVMLTGGAPFRTGTAQAVQRRHAIEDPMPIEERLRSSKLPPTALTAVIHRCLSKEQEERFVDMADLEAELCLAQIDAGIATPWDDLPLPPVDDDDRRQRILTGLQKAGRGKPVESGAPMVIETAASRPISIDDLRTVARPMPKAPPPKPAAPKTPAPKPAAPKLAVAKPAAAVRVEPPGLPQAFPMVSESGPIGASDDEPTDRNEPLSRDDEKTVVSRVAPPVPGVAPKKLPTPPVLSKPATRTIAPAPRPAPKLAAPIVSTPAKTIVTPAVASKPAPIIETPKPAPIVEAPKPAPIVEAPKSDPIVEAPAPIVETQAPAPIVERPAPAPIVETPAPAPIVETPAPAPIVETPAPAPIVETPAPVVVETPAPEPPKPTTTVVVAPVPPAAPIEETSARTVAPDLWAASVDSYDDSDIAPPKRPWALYAAIVAASLLIGFVVTRALGGDDTPDPPKTVAEDTKPPQPAPKPAQPEPAPTKAADPIEPDAAPVEETPTPTPAITKRTKKPPRTSTPRTPTSAPSEEGGEPSGSSAALYTEGNRAFNSGNYSKAESLLSKAVKQSPGNAKYRLSLGDALFKQGKYQVARIHYVKARELGHPSAARRVESVDAKLGG